MPTECSATQPKFNVKCQSDRGHTDDHRYAAGGSTIVWPQAERKRRTRAQLRADLVNHQADLEASLQAIDGVHNAGVEALHTVLPIFVKQAELMADLLDSLQSGDPRE